MRVRWRLGLLAVALMAAVLAALPGAGPAGATVTCPASASSAGAVQWLFSVIGAPTSPHRSGLSSWTRGNGTWVGGRAAGTICIEDRGGGAPERSLVLSASGASTLSPQIKRLGLLGVGIVIPVTVTASDDQACPHGSTGTVTLFASYYSVHRDSIATRFATGCTGLDDTFAGSIVRVEISRGGAQVNST